VHLVAEVLPDLADAERQLLAVGALHVLEIHKHALRRLRPQVDRVLGVLQGALEGLEHQVELADVREVMGAAVRARNVVVLDVLHHLVVAPAFAAHFSLGEAFDQLIRPVAGLALPAVHQRIRETLQVAGSLPDLRIHQDRRLNLDVVGILLDEFLLPGALDMVFQKHAVGAEVPGVAQTAVNFRSLEHETGVFGM